MSVMRPDRFVTVSFARENDTWTSFTVEWREEIDDGVNVPWERRRSEVFQIEDLPAQVKADLQSAWNGMKAHRDSLTPIE
ncbi:hypothetical protein LCGC14_1925820 [marine sediment metagenome]|uniref:Uncharacterized protein n=1 Tax=marine sediment metagenome TaxID=412755 RepID=A0A0F9FQ27_9ZZZZ